MPKSHAPVRIAVFGTKPYDRHFLDAASAGFDHQLTYFEPRLDEATVALAAGFGAVCVFVNDTLNEAVLTALHKSGGRGSSLCAVRVTITSICAQRGGWGWSWCACRLIRPMLLLSSRLG